MILSTLILLVTLSQCTDSFYHTTITATKQQQNMPLSLQSLLHSNRVGKVELLMGHLTHRMPQLLYPESILMHIHSQYQLGRDNVSQLASAFGVSEKENYRLWDSQFNITTVSDPNDRLCNEHLEALFALFLPCRNWVQLGLRHLLAIDSLTKNFLALNVTWEPSRVTFNIVQEKAKSQIILNITKNNDCGSFLVRPLSKETKHIIAQPVPVKRISLSQWYLPEKTIAFVVPSSDSQLTHFEMITRLPVGFQPISISSPQNQLGWESFIEKRLDLSHLVTIKVSLPISKQLVIHMKFKAGLPLFERFQSIAGGGQELMGLTRFYSGSQRLEGGLSFISEQLVQPDFSINFHTITACTAVFLIFWLSLWRNHHSEAQKSALQDQ